MLAATVTEVLLRAMEVHARMHDDGIFGFTGTDNDHLLRTGSLSTCTYTFEHVLYMYRYV